MVSFKNISKLCLAMMGSAVLATTSLGQQNVTFVGSAGVPDRNSSSILPYTYGRAVTPDPNVSHGIARLRYNIQPSADLTVFNNTALIVNYVDGGSLTRVIVRLYETDLYANTVHERMTFDSNAYSGSTGYQTKSSLSTFDFSFTTKAYYLEVELHKINSNPHAWLAGLQMYRY